MLGAPVSPPSPPTPPPTEQQPNHLPQLAAPQPPVGHVRPGQPAAGRGVHLEVALGLGVALTLAAWWAVGMPGIGAGVRAARRTPRTGRSRRSFFGRDRDWDVVGDEAGTSSMADAVPSVPSHQPAPTAPPPRDAGHVELVARAILSEN